MDEKERLLYVFEPSMPDNGVWVNYFSFCNNINLERDKNGLYIDKELNFGYSYPCETFDNFQLSKESKFQIQ